MLLMHHERMRADDEVWARLLHAAAAKLEQQKRTVRLAGGLGSGAGSGPGSGLGSGSG